MRILKWVGQKFSIAEWIVRHFPEHTTYVEPFGGSMAVLLTKKPSRLEVYNDIDKMLATFFLYVKKHPKALIAEISSIPSSRVIFEKMKEDMKKGCLGDTELERVVRWYYLNINSINGLGKNFGGGQVGRRRERETFIERIEEVSKRLENVLIENTDYKKVIERYDSKNTLFYIDPPYLLENGRQAEYYGNSEWRSVEKHRELYEIVSSVEGMVVISYYPHPVLEEWYSRDKGWFWDFKEVTISTHINDRSERREWLIMNFNWKEKALKQATLFDVINA